MRLEWYKIFNKFLAVPRLLYRFTHSLTDTFSFDLNFGNFSDFQNLFRFLETFQIFEKISDFWKFFRFVKNFHFQKQSDLQKMFRDDFQIFGRFSDFWKIFRFLGDNNSNKDNPRTCDIWDTDYTSDNWEPEFMTIFVTWQLIVTLDSIRNSCDVFTILTIAKITLLTIENLNSWRSLWRDNLECHWTAFMRCL